MHGHGVLARTDLGAFRRDAEHDRVVVAVIGALDLDDLVAPGVGPHQPDRLERRLGAGVGEAPQRQLEPIGQVLADHIQILRRLREVGAAGRLLLQRLDDLGVCVPDDHGAVAQMEVDVLVAVDVPEAVTPSAIGEDRVRRRVLPARRDATGDVTVRDRPVGDALRVFGFEGRLFVRDQFVDLAEIELGDSHGGTRLLGPIRVGVGLNGRSGLCPMGGSKGKPGRSGATRWYRETRTTQVVRVAAVAQSVRAPGCGPGGRGFDSRRSPFRFTCSPADGSWEESIEGDR